METLDCVVIGAGVVGLAIAAKLAQNGREVVICEKADAIGSETSSRNSEVVHAGIYYPSGSLKAKLCRAGRDALYNYAGERGIAFEKCGKLIVATQDREIVKLNAIEKTANANSVNDLKRLQPNDVTALEPEVQSVQALYSPSSGIIDSHALMLALEGDIYTKGGLVLLNAPILAGRVYESGIDLSIGGVHDVTVSAKTVINSAGLSAQNVSSTIQGVMPSSIPDLYFAIGHYYALSRKSDFKHLIYPIPETSGLGIHLTRDLSGKIKFGPDVRWIDEVGYGFDDSQKAEFIKAIQTYLPSISTSDLEPDYTGIRPKLTGPGAHPVDFQIQTYREHGARNYIALYGIESPGLTAALAIGDYIASLEG